MAEHDDYGKSVLRKAAGSAFTDWGTTITIDYGAGQPARIDGTVGKDIAVEIESRVSKQVRGAVLDLICHSYLKKLLVLLPVHMSNPEETAIQCRNIFNRFLPISDFRVIVLQGSGNNNCLDADAEIVKSALKELGFIDAV